MFAISWRNPDVEQGHFDLDTYAQAPCSRRATRSPRITGQPAVHLNGACSGGIIGAAALGHLAAEGRLGEIASLSLMVAALDNERAGTSAALVNREIAAAAVADSARRGYLDGRALEGVFTWLRPNDLVWNYVVNNYLLGKQPPAFDVLYWNQDTVRLAAGLHRDFIQIGLENSLARPDALEVLGTPVDLGAVDVDSYVVAGPTDHIIPWENAYRSTQLLGGEPRFVLSTSGHIQALVNPPATASRAQLPDRRRAPARARGVGSSRPPRCPAAGGPTTTRGSPRARASSCPAPKRSAARATRRRRRRPAPTSTRAETESEPDSSPTQHLGDALATDYFRVREQFTRRAVGALHRARAGSSTTRSCPRSTTTGRRPSCRGRCCAGSPTSASTARTSRATAARA